MKTTSYLRKCLLAVVCLMTGITAQAQDVKTLAGTAEQYPATGFATTPIDFSLTEISTELGTDTATLVKTLSEWMDAGKGKAEVNYFYLIGADGTATDAYSTNLNGGFWISKEGEATDYAGGSWYEDLSWDAASDKFTINVGQKPNTLNAGDAVAANFALILGEKAVHFSVKLSVIAKEYELPEPATLVEKELNVVGEAEVTVEQYPRTGYDADDVTMEVADLAEKLGVSGSVIADELAQMLYCTAFDLETVGKKDTLSNTFTAGAPGFWVTDIRVNGEATGECASNAYGGGDLFFAESFAFDAEKNALTFRLGQYPGNLEEKAGQTFFAYFYIIVGDKAYRIKVNLNVLVREKGNGLADYTKVGEEIVVVEQEPTDDYSTKVVRPDREAIAAALGCEVSEISMKAIDLDNNFAASTANNGGFWFNDEGFVCAWGAQACMFIEPSNAPDGETNLPDITSFNVGQYPNVFKVGDEKTARLYFFNGPEGDKYYAYGVTIKCIEPKQMEGEFENVRTISFAVQTTVNPTEYACDEEWSIDLDVIENILGTSDVKLYGLAVDSIAEKTGSIYSDKYSCDPKPGFWLDAEGRVSTWSSSSPVGVSYLSEGKYRFFQYPGVNNVGDQFKTTLFLVNTETNKMITFNITVNFVETIEKAEVVGEETIAIPVTAQGVDTPIDLSKAAEALGVAVADLTSDDNSYLRGLCDTGVYGEGKTCFEGLAFDANGYFDIINGAVFFTIDPESLVLNAFAEGIEVGDDFMLPAKFCFQIENKQYIFNAKFVSEAIYAGIKTINAEDTDSKVFDLSGRQVKQPVRGLYIMNGKKFVVK